MKKYMILLLFCIVLTGCTSKNIKESSFEETTTDAEEDKRTKTDEAAASSQEKEQVFVTKKNPKEFIALLEKFEPERDFVDMDAEKAASYGAPIQNSYEFIGRMTEDGIGYVIGFQKEETTPFSDLSIYETDNHVEAERWNEAKQDFDFAFSFPSISGLMQVDGYECIYLQPNDMEEPEELCTAFRYSDTFIYPYEKEEAIPYLEDVLERKVRFAPPENGAYLAVYRVENGMHWREYIPLTPAQEEAMLSSDTLVPLEWYGKYGLEFHVSQQVYEKTDQEMHEITEPMLAIAKERCRFVAYEITEIRELIKAELCYRKTGTRDEEAILIREELTDPEKLKKLEEILVSSTDCDEGKCPYCGVLKLTRADGKEFIANLAMDSCDGFILGSRGVYSPGKKKTEELWELFPKIREYSGWQPFNSEKSTLSE
ncbi:MAG: hypothetical protein HFE84_06220 [Lachnospiraceae bacterium]|nr:hypothetical protein [Lachnospiraceae bacterium]